MNEKPNIEILKEPKGFIKGIELVVTIFAFATVAGFVGNFQFTVNCEAEQSGYPSSRVVKGKFFYPFKGITLYTVPDGQKFCANETETVDKQSTLDMNYMSEAQYFVFTGVVSMLFVLVALVYYVMFEDRAKEATSTDVGLFSFPVVDFVVTVLLVIFWFTSAIAWASALSGLKDATGEKKIFEGYKACSNTKITTCGSFVVSTYGSATVSVVFGFLNFFVWGGNLWFLFKETPWHSPRSSGRGGKESVPQEPPIQDTPPASAI